jgi:hypothetical protein
LVMGDAHAVGLPLVTGGILLRNNSGCPPLRGMVRRGGAPHAVLRSGGSFLWTQPVTCSYA